MILMFKSVIVSRGIDLRYDWIKPILLTTDYSDSFKHFQGNPINLKDTHEQTPVQFKFTIH